MLDQMTRGSAQAGVIGLGRREREFAEAYVDANRRMFAEFLAGLPDEEKDAYLSAKAREAALGWTRNTTDPAYVQARADVAAATSRVESLKAELVAVSS